MNKQIKYTLSDAFSILLNSCGSMTKELESIGNKFSVEILKCELVNDIYYRHVLLKLNSIAVVIATGKCSIHNQYLYSLLYNANTQPIGKFIFAENSNINRAKIKITEILATEANSPIITTELQKNYANAQQFWQRISKFTYQEETLILEEIILPEVGQFLNQ